MSRLVRAIRHQLSAISEELSAAGSQDAALTPVDMPSGTSTLSQGEREVLEGEPPCEPSLVEASRLGRSLALQNPEPRTQNPEPGGTFRLNRRQLFKLGGVGAAMAGSSIAAARVAMAEDLIRGGKSVSRTTAQVRRAVPSSCALCGARCGILGFLEDDRLVKIEGNPRDPNSRGRLCARGQAGLNRLYDPDRVLTPMKRAGKRGEGKWTQISWEEAYQTLQDRLQELQAQSADSLVLHVGTEARIMLGGRFVTAVGSKALIDEARLLGASDEAANRAVLGSSGAVVDIARARYVLNFGGNPYENHAVYVPFVQRLVDARIGGARLVTFDPRLSYTAGRSDEWFPVAPGSDGVVALAIANVILQQNLHDAQFLSNLTDVTPEELAKQLAPYTPDAASAASGIPADAIRRVATEFGRVKPAVAVFGGGVNYQAGAVDTQKAVLLLNAVVGAVGTAGGYSPAQGLDIAAADPAPTETLSTGESLQLVDDLLQGKRKVGIYMTALANPAYSWPDSAAFKNTLLDESRIGFLVAMDTNLTETSMLADMLLPAATYLESWGLEAPPAQEMVPFVALRQPVVRARGDSLSVDDMLLTMGTRLAGRAPQMFPFPTIDSYVSKVVAKVPGLSEIGFAALRDRGIWYDTGKTAQYLPGGSFATPSGKLQLSGIAAKVQASSDPPATVTVGSDSKELTLVTYHPNVHSGEYSANCWLLEEISHNNALLINPVAARQRGIIKGQQVKITSAAGEIVAPVQITQGIHPQVVALALGFGHGAVGRIARNEQFKSSDPMTSHIWWSNEGTGVDANSLISGKRADGGGLVWMNTKVRVEALG